MKDATFVTNESGTPALAINHEYVKNILFQILFTRSNDAYSNRGVNLEEARFKSLSDVQYLIPIISRNIEKYTDFYPTTVEFKMYGNVLILILAIYYQDQLLNITIDPDSKNIGFLPLA